MTRSDSDSLLTHSSALLESGSPRAHQSLLSREMKLPDPSNPGLEEKFMHKNRLQEYAQKSSIPLPSYETVNEGYPHAPQFKSAVTVDGITFRSNCTFTHLKEAEQYIAKLAFEGLSRKIKHEDVSLLYQDLLFCKSILNEYAIKMNMAIPTYTTSQAEGIVPVFISSLIFDGKTYTGDAGRSKKDAEQLAARTVIESILANSSTRTLLSQIIKSKGRLYAALHKGSSSGSLQATENFSAKKPEDLYVQRPSSGTIRSDSDSRRKRSNENQGKWDFKKIRTDRRLPPTPAGASTVA